MMLKLFCRYGRPSGRCRQNPDLDRSLTESHYIYIHAFIHQCNVNPPPSKKKPSLLRLYFRGVDVLTGCDFDSDARPCNNHEKVLGRKTTPASSSRW